MEKRSIRSYTRRERILNSAQKQRFNELFSQYAIVIDEKRLREPNLHVLFNNTTETIILDIGFGYGESLIALAKENPEVNFLGVEVNKHCIFRCLRNIEEGAIQNIKLIHYDAMELIQNILVAKNFSGIHIFFPDPWPKKRHHKRRFVQENSIPSLARMLNANGYLYFVSDWVDYVKHAQALLDNSSAFTQESNQSAEWWKPSGYERKASRAGRGIHHLIYRKSTK